MMPQKQAQPQEQSTEIKEHETKLTGINRAENECDSLEAESISPAQITARRLALIEKLEQKDIVQRIINQYSTTTASEAEGISLKALDWAKKYQIGEHVQVDGIPKKITDMKTLDARFAQLEAPCQPCVLINRIDALPITDADLKKRLSGEVVVIGVDAKGKVKFTSASAYWAGNAKKHIYRQIVFTSEETEKDAYNLFTGFGVDPREGDCSKILTHIKEVICAGNQENFDALIKLLAWQVQNIGKPSRIIVVLKSKDQQVGKGALLQDVLLKIYGNAGLMTSDMGQITGRFNDTLRGKAYIYLDEALFSGDHKAADSVKSLATMTQLSVEAKGQPIVRCPFGTNLFLTTNHDNAAPIEEADARYWVLEADPKYVKDTKYFGGLFKEIEGSGVEAFLDHLLALEIENFIPWRDVPKDNEFKDAMIRNSINPYDARKWLEACCVAEIILGLKPQDNIKEPWECWLEGQKYPNGMIYAAYTEWQKTVKSPIAAKPTSAKAFGELLNKAGLEPSKSGGTRYRTLPDPEECLKTVIKMIEKTAKK